MSSDTVKTDAYAAFRIKDFRLFIFSRFFLTVAIQMQSVIVGWQIYGLTHDALSLGLIGLSEVIPFFCVTLFAGHIADIVSRKKITLTTNIIYSICALGLLLISTEFHSVINKFGTLPIYSIIFITGIARGFLSPAQISFAVQLVPHEILGNALTWNSVSWQTAEISGPAIGGLICGFYGIGTGYSIVTFLSIVGACIFVLIKDRPIPEKTKEENIWQSLTAGLRFVFTNQIVLSAMTLDMFAVFFGGAVCILPIFSDQILHTGAKGLGFLRAAPAIGAVTMSVIQAYWPPFRKAGRNLLFAVSGFGICIILFAFTRNFYLALFVLMLSGMFDNVSVVIRGTITQIHTPNEMRGRVSAVNGIFISSSNELGSFESGVMARLLGLITSIVFGGSMTVLVVGAVRKFAPKLRKLSL